MAVADWLSCSSCQTLSMMSDPTVDKACPVCGRMRHVVSHEQVKQGMEAGAYFNIDPATGKRKKPRKR